MHIVYTHNHTSQRLYTTRLYTPIIRPTYTQSAHTDIHTPRPKCPEIRYALSTRLYAPIRPLYTQRAHTDIHISRPERPEIRDVHCARKTETFVIREMEQKNA